MAEVSESDVEVGGVKVKDQWNSLLILSVGRGERVQNCWIQRRPG